MLVGWPAGWIRHSVTQRNQVTVPAATVKQRLQVNKQTLMDLSVPAQTGTMISLNAGIFGLLVGRFGVRRVDAAFPFNALTLRRFNVLTVQRRKGACAQGALRARSEANFLRKIPLDSGLVQE